MTGHASRQLTPETSRHHQAESRYNNMMHGTSGQNAVTSSPIDDVKPSGALHPDQHRNDLLLPPPAPVAVPSSEIDRRCIDSTLDTTMLLPRYQSLTDVASRLPAPEHLLHSRHESRSMFPASPSFSYPSSSSNLTLLEQNKNFPALTTNCNTYPIVPSYFTSVSPTGGSGSYMSGGSPTNSISSPYRYSHLYGSPTIPQYNAGLYIHPTNTSDTRHLEREVDILRMRTSPPEQHHHQQHIIRDHSMRDVKLEALEGRGMMPTLTPAPNVSTSGILIPIPVQNAAAQHDDSGPVWRPY